MTIVQKKSNHNNNNNLCSTRKVLVLAPSKVEVSNFVTYPTLDTYYGPFMGGYRPLTGQRPHTIIIVLLEFVMGENKLHTSHRIAYNKNLGKLV